MQVTLNSLTARKSDEDDGSGEEWVPTTVFSKSGAQVNRFSARISVPENLRAPSTRLIPLAFSPGTLRELDADAGVCPPPPDANVLTFVTTGVEVDGIRDRRKNPFPSRSDTFVITSVGLEVNGVALPLATGQTIRHSITSNEVRKKIFSHDYTITRLPDQVFECNADTPVSG